MGKDCVYCKIALNENSVVDVCQRCGVGVWGVKMFDAIKQNMENARQVGDLYQGSVMNQVPEKPAMIPFAQDRFQQNKPIEIPQTEINKQIENLQDEMNNPLKNPPAPQAEALISEITDTEVLS